MTGSAGNIEVAQNSKTEKVWECNECGAQEYSGGVSYDDIHKLACSDCGCNEWHLDVPR